MDVNLFNVQCLLKNEQKLDSFAAHYGQHYEYTTSCTDLCQCMTSKEVKQTNTIRPLNHLQNLI